MTRDEHLTLSNILVFNKTYQMHWLFWQQVAWSILGFGPDTRTIREFLHLAHFEFQYLLVVLLLKLYLKKRENFTSGQDVVQIEMEWMVKISYLLDWNVSFKEVTLAPASSYVLFGKLDNAPAFSSMLTVNPFFTNLLTTAGTTATLKNKWGSDRHFQISQLFKNWYQLVTKIL